jgi:hypothetical protein
MSWPPKIHRVTRSNNPDPGLHDSTSSNQSQLFFRRWIINMDIFHFHKVVNGFESCQGLLKGILARKMIVKGPWNPYNLLQDNSLTMTHGNHLWPLLWHSFFLPVLPDPLLDFLWMKIMSHLEAKEVPEQRLTASTELRHGGLRMAADSLTLPAAVLGLASRLAASDLPRWCNWDHIGKTSSILSLSQLGLLTHTGILYNTQ